MHIVIATLTFVVVYVNLVNINVDIRVVSRCGFLVIYDVNTGMFCRYVGCVNLINPVFGFHGLGKLMLLLGTHSIPLFSSISVVDAAIPVEHAAGAYLCSCLGKSLREGCACGGMSYMQRIVTARCCVCCAAMACSPALSGRLCIVTVGSHCRSGIDGTCAHQNTCSGTKPNHLPGSLLALVLVLVLNLRILLVLY